MPVIVSNFIVPGQTGVREQRYKPDENVIIPAPRFSEISSILCALLLDHYYYTGVICISVSGSVPQAPANTM